MLLNLGTASLLLDYAKEDAQALHLGKLSIPTPINVNVNVEEEDHEDEEGEGESI
jgi:hypothetical protein